MFSINSIGKVKSENYNFQLEICEAFRPGLKELDKFSHVHVFWWASNHDNEADRNITQTELPYAKNTIGGVFACRSPYRPNPIAVTICKIINLDIENGILDIEYIDAFNNTPIIDLKPYIPVSDRVRDVNVAVWFSNFPDWYEEAGEFFKNYSF